MFKFDVAKIDAIASGGTGRVQLDVAQEKLIKDLADMIAPRIGFDPIPCRGLWLRAVKDWQLAHGRTADTLSKGSPVARMQAAIEIKDHFARLASELLVDDAKKAELARVIGEAFALYMQKYNRRPNDPGSR